MGAGARYFAIRSLVRGGMSDLAIASWAIEGLWKVIVITWMVVITRALAKLTK